MSESKLIINQSPYVLDFLSGKGIIVPALTRKNADFIEAVVHLDSNYGKDDDVNSKPDNAFNVENNYSNSNGLYCGSTAFWFNEMKAKKNAFDECLLGAIIAIDRTNSTHLEATIDGRREMRRIIKTSCNDVNSLREEINKQYSQSPQEHLIGKMSVELPAKGKSGTRSNLSFASKFCSYAAHYLNCNVSYSKYDNVVSDHLKDYVLIYLNQKIHKSDIQYDSQRKNRFESSEKKISYITNIYLKYSDFIERILSTLESEDKTLLSKDELDHIIWYGFKGR